MESSSGRSVRNVTISVTAPLPLTTHPSHFILPEVSSTLTAGELLLTVVCTPSILPTSTNIIQLSATYVASDGIVI